MQANHTPGPWAYDADSREVFSNDERHGAGWVAFIKGNDSDGKQLTEPERLANARLIAAAPELLAALREARVMVRAMTGDAPASAPWNALLPRIDAAIARATGADHA